MQKENIDAYLTACKALAEKEGGLGHTLAVTMGVIAKSAPEVAHALVAELVDQRSSIKLIASENYCSPAVQLAMGNWLTDKYSEGVAGARFYAGCENIDVIERQASELAKKLFGAGYCYVQPHSGIDANLVAFSAILAQRAELPVLKRLELISKAGKILAQKLGSLDRDKWNEVRAAWGGQRLLALDFSAGGHLTHGYRANISARLFDAYSYNVDPKTFLLDYDEIEKIAKQVRPLVLLAGYSAYPRKIDFKRMRAIADSVGAVLMVDMAHFAGLVAGGVFGGTDSPLNPIGHADVVTSTTHKTLRGPRGGIVLCKEEFAGQVDRGCPAVLGGPLPHVMAAKAVAFGEALQPSFSDYAQRIVANSQALAKRLTERGLTVVSGGTDNHLVLVDLSAANVNGLQAEAVLRSCGVTLNRNAIPYDKRPPWVTSGLRLGTAAMTTRGLGTGEMAEIANIIADVLETVKPGASDGAYELDETFVANKRGVVRELTGKFPLYAEYDRGGP